MRVIDRMMSNLERDIDLDNNKYNQIHREGIISSLESELKSSKYFKSIFGDRPYNELFGLDMLLDF